MVVSPLKVLLFLAGGTAAAAATAYVTGALDPYLQPRPPVVAALPGAQGEPEAPASVIPAPVVEEPAGADAVPDEPQAPAVVAPAFDLLRVEADGSIVVAGRAAPGSGVELVSGSTVIGTAEAGPEGDFVIVIEVPLAPGDYQLVLRSTTAENVVTTSVETATVSIPRDGTGQVLALVEQPGQPSRLITVPEPVAEAAEEEAPAVEEDVAAAVPEGEAPPPAETVGEEAAETETPAPGQDDAVAEAEAPEPVQEDVAAEEAEEEIAAAPDAAVTDDAPDAAGEDEIAALAPETPEEADGISAVEPAEAAAEPAVELVVAVEAVEIEGGRIFVAGRANPGSIIRVYANEILLGDTVASDGGRFLVEALRELPVGDYIIRADMLSPDGATVLARAAVPFEREPGENIAAVAPSMPVPEGDAEAQEPADLSQAPVEDAGAPPESVTAGEAEEPTQDAPVAAAPAPEAVEETVEAEASPAEEAPAAAVAPSVPDAPVAAAEPVEVPETEVETDIAADAAVPEEDVAGTPEEDVAAAPADTIAETEAGSAGEAPAVALVTPEDEATAPRLESVQGAVIIRRGDSLWRISRRVYGRGIRYSTIYLANQDQIADPGRIWPGQVFRVPDTSDDGRAADMRAIGGQATTITK